MIVCHVSNLFYDHYLNNFIKTVGNYVLIKNVSILCQSFFMLILKLFPNIRNTGYEKIILQENQNELSKNLAN